MTLDGLVLERDGAQYRVHTGAGEVRAVLRGKAKHGAGRGEARVVVGDRVTLDPEPQGGLFGIVATAPRHSLLERRVPEGRGARPVVANCDRVLVVTATVDPAPLPQLLDRLLVVAAVNDIPAAVVLNKVDLDPGDALAARFARAGYPVFRTSVRARAGLEALRAELGAHVSVVTGPSGVGKSSLLNAIEPELRLRTGAISEKVRRGRHTTVGAVMIPLASGGWLVDTPGFSEVGLWGVEPRELARCFPEFAPRVDACRFADCRHRGEPGCAVAEAVEAGAADADRLVSYRMLLAELEAAPADWE